MDVVALVDEVRAEMWEKRIPPLCGGSPPTNLSPAGCAENVKILQTRPTP